MKSVKQVRFRLEKTEIVLINKCMSMHAGEFQQDITSRSCFIPGNLQGNCHSCEILRRYEQQSVLIPF